MIILQIMAVTCDSAANNGTFMKFLAKECESLNLNHISRTGSMVNCFAHILNLTVQDFLKGISCCESGIIDDSSEDEEEEEDDDLFEEEFGPREYIAPSNLMKKVKRKST